MSEITEELKTTLQEYNQELRHLYRQPEKFSGACLRQLIEQQIGKIDQLKEINPAELDRWSGPDAVVGVDGSVNQVGSSFPHYLIIMQALAKSVTREEGGITKQKIFSPLTERDWNSIESRARSEQISLKEAAEKLSTARLAELEIKAAQASIKHCAPQLIVMDGSLIRYRTEAEAEWKKLVELSLEKDVLLVGIIEEVGTCKLSEVLGGDLPANMRKMYDRELLFGLLDKGERLVVDKTINFKSDLLQTVFLRPAQAPGVIGMDILQAQRTNLDFLSNLVYSLTPENSRGIPLWLDIVDEQVKITNQMIEALVDNYLDADIKQRLLHSKRKDRIY